MDDRRARSATLFDAEEERLANSSRRRLTLSQLFAAFALTADDDVRSRCRLEVERLSDLHAVADHGDGFFSGLHGLFQGNSSRVTTFFFDSAEVIFAAIIRF